MNAADEQLVAELSEALGEHGDTMSRTWSDNDAEPVTVVLGCRCGFVRGTVTARELSADLPGYIRAHREHVAAALLPTVLADRRRAVAEALREAADELRQRGVGPEVFVVDDMADALEAGQ